MKKVMVVLSIIMHGNTIYSMDEELEMIVDRSPASSLPSIVRAYDQLSSESCLRCNGNSQKQRENLVAQYQQILSTRAVDASWPDATDNNVENELDWRNKNLSILSALQGDKIVSVFVTVPNRIDLSKVTKLDISDNKLDYLPLNHVINHCHGLVELDASYNALEYVSLQGIEENKTLNRIDLSYNKLSSFDLTPLFHKTDIKSIDLSNNPLTSVALTNFTKKDPFDDVFQYPRVTMHNTQLSEEQKKTLSKAYVYQAQSSIRSFMKVTSAGIGALVTIIGLIVVGKTPKAAKALGIKNDQDSMAAEGFCFSLLAGGSAVAYPFVYWGNFKSLKKIEREAQSCVVFEDMNNVSIQ